MKQKQRKKLNKLYARCSFLLFTKKKYKIVLLLCVYCANIDRLSARQRDFSFFFLFSCVHLNRFRQNEILSSLRKKLKWWQSFDEMARQPPKIIDDNDYCEEILIKLISNWCYFLFGSSKKKWRIILDARNQRTYVIRSYALNKMRSTIRAKKKRDKNKC